jgi:ribosomal protein L18
VFPRSDINNLENAQVAMMGMNSPIAAAQQTEAAVNTMAMGSTMKNIEAANARGTDVAANEAISETGGSVR